MNVINYASESARTRIKQALYFFFLYSHRIPFYNFGNTHIYHIYIHIFLSRCIYLVGLYILPSPQTGLGDPATKRLHILAVVFSLTGAVLISDPAHAISSMGCLDFSSVREAEGTSFTSLIIYIYMGASQNRRSGTSSGTTPVPYPRSIPPFHTSLKDPFHTSVPYLWSIRYYIIYIYI